MASFFPQYRNADTIPTGGGTSATPLQTGDILVHPNGILYQYTAPISPAQDKTDYWRAIRFYLSNDYVLKGGDTMTGPLTLDGDPSLPLEAATKQYVDATDSTIIPFIIALS